MYSLDTIKGRLQCYPLALEADEVSPILIRVATPLKYPDGSNIDIFIENPQHVLDYQQAKVTDLGSTFDWLFNAAVHTLESRQRRTFIQDIVQVLRVSYNAGEIYTWVASEEELPDAVMRVAQASLRVSDLLFTKRLVKGPELQEAFADFLDAIDLPFAERVEVETPARKITFPYQVTGKTAQSWVQLLGSRNPDAAHSTSLEAFMRWYDTRDVHPEINRVTVYDDQSNAYKEYDIVRFSDYSQVIPWSDQSALHETLKR